MEKSALLTIPGIKHGFYNKCDSKEDERPITLSQIHSFLVVTVTQAGQALPPADALVTNQPGLNLTLKTADCAPVLFADPAHHVIGAAHAGWKGAFKGVLEQTILAMIRLGASIENIRAAIGPCIHAPSYPITDDMKTVFSVNAHPYFKPYGSQEHFDLPGYVKYRLQEIGLRLIDQIDIDTYVDMNYNSYRRDPTNPARQYSSICLEN